MSVGITLLGASYSDVSGVSLPKTGGGTVTFPEVSDTTATAADVASGKYFYTSAGVRTQGTASGGGGSSAELVQKWTYNKLAVQDESITIPSYSTSAKTLKATWQAGTSTNALDLGNYNYFIVTRVLVYPIYASGTNYSNGRFEYGLSARIHDIVYIPANAIKANNVSYATEQIGFKESNEYNIVYWSGSSRITAGGNSYGIYFNTSATQQMGNDKKVTCWFPAVQMRGSSTYLSSTFWNAISDIRIQCVMELWKMSAAATSIQEAGLTAQAMHIINCYNDNNRVLT